MLADSYKPEDVPWVEPSEASAEASDAGPPPPPTDYTAPSVDVPFVPGPPSDMSEAGSDCGSVASSG